MGDAYMGIMGIIEIHGYLFGLNHATFLHTLKNYVFTSEISN